jgi:DHA2 family multidrug resistance protein-like MFS transporter
MHRTAPSALASVAFIFAALCAAALALVPPTLPDHDTVRLLLLAGVGLGIGTTVTFASSVIMNAAPPERGGMAASIEEVGFELGNSLGVAVFGTVLTLSYSLRLILPESMATLPGSVRDSLDEALAFASQLPATDAATLRAAASLAFGKAVSAVLLGVAALWACTALTIAMVRHRQGRQ